MDHLKEYLNNNIPDHIIIGSDPSITSTGWAVVLVIGSQFTVVEHGNIKPKGATTTQKLYDLHIRFDAVVKEMVQICLPHYLLPAIQGALESPKVFLKGLQRATRDTVQREAICAVRLVYAKYHIELAGEQGNKQIAPITVHALAGATRSKTKKEDVRQWLYSNTEVLYPFEGDDASDAAAIAICGYNKFTNSD